MADPNEDKIARLIRSGDLLNLKNTFALQPEYVQRHFRNAKSWLDMAVESNRPEIIDYLLSLGCDINVGRVKFPDETPLFSALAEDNPQLVGFLLQRGADPTRRKMVITAITGLNTNSLEMVKLLEQYGADVHEVYENQLTNQPMNALSAAIEWGKDDVASYLRSRGAVLPAATPKPANTSTLSAEVIAYFAEHFGPVDPKALIEIVPTALPPIAIHVIPPSKDRNHVTLFTTGMSSEPMTVPDEEGADEFRFAEIFIQLPSDWKYQEVGDPNWGWPQHWLRSMAQYPHINETWLGGPVTLVANDDPPQPLAPNTKFTTLLLLAEHSFVSKDGKVIQLYRMSPLYTEERELEIREGIAALLQAFDKAGVPFVVDMSRPNVATQTK